MGSADDLRRKHGSRDGTCVVQRCRKRKCSISGFGPHSVIIECDACDAFSSEERRPDYIVFVRGDSENDHMWLVVELKGGLDDADKVVEQIQAGAATVEGHELFQINTPRSRTLIAVVLFDGNSRVAEHQRINAVPVMFYNRPFRVRALRCKPGLTLSELIG